MKFDGRVLLKNSDVFIGSGGTMTAEAALLGVPTVSYNAVPNRIEEFLVRQKLARRQTDPKKVSKDVQNLLKTPKKTFVNRSKTILKSMDDPFKKLKPLL